MSRYFFIAFLLLLGQCGGPEPRPPVKVKTGSFLKESANRNKELLAREEALIQNIIAADSTNQYLSTDFGAWYYYNTRVSDDSALAGEDDLVRLNYNMVSFQNDTIYSMQEIGTIDFRVDKEDYFPGLRMGVKVLRAGEIATFLFPSSLAYGYHGDGDRIGTNIPVKSTISILDIKQTKDSIQ